jgi:cell division control protein 45
MGAILELTSATDWFGGLTNDLTLHVIDSMRPHNLSSLFLGGDIGERFIVWDDGEADKLQEERKAWEALQVCNLLL